MTFERLYSELGMVPSTLEAPGRVAGNPALNAFPTPTVNDAEDWDQDGNPGITYVVTNSPIGSGTRFAIQRAWNELAGPIAYSPSEFLIPITWNFDDLVIVASNPFLASEASVRQSPHTAQYRRLAPADVVGADDRETCSNLRTLMPHTAQPMEAF